MPRLYFLSIVAILFCSCAEKEEIDFKEAIYGTYEGTQVANFWNLLGETKTETFDKVFEISPHSEDTVMINDVLAYIDTSLQWSPYPFTTQYRYWAYNIERNKLVVKYRTGGNGSGWYNEFIGWKQ